MHQTSEAAGYCRSIHLRIPLEAKVQHRACSKQGMSLMQPPLWEGQWKSDVLADKQIFMVTKLGYSKRLASRNSAIPISIQVGGAPSTPEGTGGRAAGAAQIVTA